MDMFNKVPNISFFLKKKKSHKGLIFNMGSFAGLVATPYLSVYSAGKAFLSTWSQALGTEVAKDGIVVEHVNTYFVVSAMSKIRKPSLLIPNPDKYVASVLSKIGVPCGANVPFTSTPYPMHGVVNWAINNLFTNQFWITQNDSKFFCSIVCRIKILTFLSLFLQTFKRIFVRELCVSVNVKLLLVRPSKQHKNKISIIDNKKILNIRNTY